LQGNKLIVYKDMIKCFADPSSEPIK